MMFDELIKQMANEIISAMKTIKGAEIFYSDLMHEVAELPVRRKWLKGGYSAKDIPTIYVDVFRAIRNHITDFDTDEKIYISDELIKHMKAAAKEIDCRSIYFLYHAEDINEMIEDGIRYDY